MAALSQAYTDTMNTAEVVEMRVRTGGPFGSRPTSPRDDWYARYLSSGGFGSHMPLDTEIHWDWRNPLNVIPAIMLVLLIVAVLALVW
jgi:hypothetical protein